MLILYLRIWGMINNTKFEIRRTKTFERSLKKAVKKNFDINSLKDIIYKLANDIPLDKSNKDHQLKGNMKDFRECHIKNDWILLYMKNRSKLILTLVDNGTHEEIFGK